MVSKLLGRNFKSSVSIVPFRETVIQYTEAMKENKAKNVKKVAKNFDLFFNEVFAGADPKNKYSNFFTPIYSTLAQLIHHERLLN